MNKLNREDLKEAKNIASEKVDIIKVDLERKLNKLFDSAVHMEYGQIKRAAKYTVITLGYRWFLREETEDKYIRMYMRMNVKICVKKIVAQWHDNPNRVWLQFEKYCLEFAAAAAARDAIKKFTMNN